MPVRSAAFTAVLVFVFAAASPAKRPPSPGDKQAPTTPTNLRITASSDTSVSLAWNASTDNSTNWWYCVQVDGSGCRRVDPPTTTFTQSNLIPDRTRIWTVYAIDAAGNRSVSSNPVTHTTPPDTTPPSPPPTLTAAAVHPWRITVVWSESFDNVTHEPSYTLYLNGLQVWDSIVYRHFLALNLSPSTAYEFKITARDGAGNVAEGDVLTVTTPPKTDFVAPTAPTNVTLGFQSSTGEAWLTWDPSTDDTDPQSQLFYAVYFNGVSHDDDGALGSNGTIAYCRAAVGPTEIVVRAIDTNGNVSAPSNAIPFDC